MALERRMTVAELIAELSKHRPDDRVSMVSGEWARVVSHVRIVSGNPPDDEDLVAYLRVYPDRRRAATKEGAK